MAQSDEGVGLSELDADTAGEVGVLHEVGDAQGPVHGRQFTTWGLRKGVQARSSGTSASALQAESLQSACDNRPMEPRAGNSRILLVAPALLLFGLAILVHLDALHGWWLSDDPQVLVQAMRYSPAAILFDPPSWRYLSSSSFTPLVTLSFALDLVLAGLRPAFFYAHQLVMIGIATVLLFLLLAKGGRVLIAFLGAATFIVLPATFNAAGSLMIRHYLEGLVLSLLALLFWIPSGEERRSLRRTIVPALLYLAAMLAKEFYAPLPLLMIWIDYVKGVTPRRTAVRILPTAVSAVVYIVWRTIMLGSGVATGRLLLPPISWRCPAYSGQRLPDPCLWSRR